MRTVETKVYLFSELSDDAKQRAIDWYRSIDSFQIGAETFIENSKDIGGILGIEIEKIYYSGFFSQGGGACFEGNYFYNPDAVVKIKKNARLMKFWQTSRKNLTRYKSAIKVSLPHECSIADTTTIQDACK